LSPTYIDPQVLQIQQEETVVVGDLEDQAEHAALRVVEAQDPAEEQRSHLRDGRTQRMALFTEDIPEDDREGLELKFLELQLPDPLVDLGVVSSRPADGCQVALDVGHENGNADGAELLGEDTEGYGFSGARRPGDEPVTVGHFGKDGNIVFGFCDGKRGNFGRHVLPPLGHPM